ncbi:MAG TPA: type II secretion system minor pseudopilin GspJ [Legionellaceae bacterium]|nr:type II secretion system minor pseudopilin GspJ [Legionellaceae bacterium]
MKQRGFTLIEMMTALGIFSIIAAITAYVLINSFHTDEKLKAQAARFHQLLLSTTLMRRETQQMINRPVRGNEQSLFPALIGHMDGVEFTRNGAINPGALEQRSTLKRSAYLCYGQKLIRRSWTLLDTPDRRNYHDEILFDQLTACGFSYIDTAYKIHSNWTIVPKDKTKQRPPLPAGIILHLTFEKWGALDITFSIPGGLYG